MRKVLAFCTIIFLVGLISAFSVPGTFTVSPQDDEATSGGGTGGGSGGDQESSLDVEECEEDLRCDEWGECIQFSQFRTCTDINNCELPNPRIEKTFCVPDDFDIGETLQEESPIFHLPNWVALSISAIFLIFLELE